MSSKETQIALPDPEQEYISLQEWRTILAVYYKGTRSVAQQDRAYIEALACRPLPDDIQFAVMRWKNREPAKGRTVPLKEGEKLIMNAISVEHEKTAAGISRVTGLCLSNVGRLLRSMYNANILTRTTSGNAHFYQLADNDSEVLI